MANKDAPNPIDKNTEGLIGKDVDRVEGPMKVTGQIPYAYEYQLEGQSPGYGFIVNSSIAKGKITSIDTMAAEKSPGVLLVMTYLNAPKQKGSKPTVEQGFTDAKPYLKDNIIRYYGEPVAFVVADTFENARAASALVNVRYAADKNLILRAEPNRAKAVKPAKSNGQEADSKSGDFEKAFTNAPVQIDSTFTTPFQNHMAMEPHATIAVWNDNKLTLYTANQLAVEAQAAVAKTFNLSKDDVRIICRYIGGGFGGKLPVQCDAILSALAAKQLGRPVKTAMTRPQVFFNATHRTESTQRIRLGAEKDGTLTSIAHECLTECSSFDEYAELAATCTRSLYAAPNRLTSHRLVHCDLPPSGSMRAPGEAIGMLTLEQAMDELADKLKIDPIELRIRNEPTEDPEKKIPFSSRNLIPCMRQGAEKFGWNNRNAVPGQTRDGDWLVGLGMCAAIRPNFMMKSSAKVILDKNGHLTAKLAMTDPGTGSYTIMTQIAAETMGLPLDAVKVDMGDSTLPPTPGSGGSWGANSAGSGLFEACMALREKLVSAAIKDKSSPLYKQDEKSAIFEKGSVQIDGKSESLQAIAARIDAKDLEADGDIKPPATYKKFSQASYGAFFAEVGVDVYTGEIRVRRMLGAFAAGRILNAKTARSQAIGGMIWGIGSALVEQSVVDKRWGNFVNRDLAEYHVPVHADCPNIDAFFLPEVDDKTGPLKIKGVGELGICGAGAAIANAVYNASGIRIRDYPLTLDKVLPFLPKAA